MNKTNFLDISVLLILPIFLLAETINAELHPLKYLANTYFNHASLSLIVITLGTFAIYSHKSISHFIDSLTVINKLKGLLSYLISLVFLVIGSTLTAKYLLTETLRTTTEQTLISDMLNGQPLVFLSQDFILNIAITMTLFGLIALLLKKLLK